MKKFLLTIILTLTALCAYSETHAPLFYSDKTLFAWGAEAGASIDMTGNDMSSVDVAINFGMRRSWLNFLGVGVAADIMVSQSTRSFPLYVNFRTSFVNRPALAFMDLKLGASLNYLEHNHQQTGLFGYAGVGFNLAQNTKYCSHLSIGYTYLQRRRVVGPEMTHDFKSLSFASVKLGVTF